MYITSLHGSEAPHGSIGCHGEKVNAGFWGLKLA